MEAHKQFFYEYTVLYRPYFNQLNTVLSAFNLSLSQWMIMRFILDNGTHTISEISIQRNVERPTTTKMVQKLNELGYVEARAGEDKRTKFIELTKTGREVSKQVQEKVSNYQKYLLEEVSEADQLLVAGVLRNISEKITTYKG